MTGTQKGKLGPLPASNKEGGTGTGSTSCCRRADGKVQHGWGYANLVEMMQQTGALKAPGAAPAPKAEAPKAAVPAPDASKTDAPKN